MSTDGPFTRRRLSRKIDDLEESLLKIAPYFSGITIFVSSALGTIGGTGLTIDDPILTIAAANTLVAAATAAQKNDATIVCLAGHNETLTAAGQCALTTAGMKLIGLGQRGTKPTIYLGTATTTDVDIDAANITIKNINFISVIDDLAVMIDVNAGGTTFEDCQFYGPSALECLNFVNLATTFDDFTFRRCEWIQEADPTGTDGAAATGGIYVVDTERVLVEDCTFDGFFETACLHNKTTAMKALTWRRNSVNQALTITGRRLLLLAASTRMAISPDTDFMPNMGYMVSKTEDVNTATRDDLFTVVGKVLIGLWTGEVTNALGTQPTDYLLEVSAGGALSAAGNIASAAIGFMFQLSSDPADTLLVTGTNGGVAVVKNSDPAGHGLSNRVVGLDGLGSLLLAAKRTAGDASDAIVHKLWYIPLEPGAYVVAAA